MAEIKPFCAIRPPRDKAHLVASRSYISYSDQHLQDKLIGNPYTFIHIINPEYYLGLDERTVGTARFPLVKQVFDDFVERDILQKDQVPAFYLYRQSHADYSFMGIIGGASVEEYLQGKIKIHEKTITHREQLFKSYLETCDFNAEPVLLTHKKHDDIRLIFTKYADQRPEYEFCTTDTVKHEVWVISDPVDIQLVQKAYSSIPELYIADGHHRSASSAILGADLRGKAGNPDRELASDYYMACLITDNELKIFPFHRGVRRLKMEKDAFIKRLKSVGTLVPTPKLEAPLNRLEIGVEVDGHHYKLILSEEKVNMDDPIQSLSAQILSDFVLDPVLNIDDPQKDPNLMYYGGPNALDELSEALSCHEIEVGFTIAAIGVDEVMRVADAGGVMPPKSTWVEPKLRSGMLVYGISEW